MSHTERVSARTGSVWWNCELRLPCACGYDPERDTGLDAFGGPDTTLIQSQWPMSPRGRVVALDADSDRLAKLERIREAADRLAEFLTLNEVLDDRDAFDLLLELEAELGTLTAPNKQAITGETHLKGKQSQ